MSDLEARVSLIHRLWSLLRDFPDGDRQALDALMAADGRIVHRRLDGLPTDILATVTAVLAEAGLLERIGNDPLQSLNEREYFVGNADEIERVLEDVIAVGRTALAMQFPCPLVLRTWPFSEPIPGSIARETLDLDLYLMQLLAKARSRVLIVSPFMNHEGAERLLHYLPTLIEQGVAVDLISYRCHEEGSSRDAVLHIYRALERNASAKRLERFRAFAEMQPGLMIHAKAMLVDGEYGYIGSANLTRQGFSEHFEIGVSLTRDQVQAIERLFYLIIDQGHVAQIKH